MDKETAKWLRRYQLKYSEKTVAYENRYKQYHVARDRQFAIRYMKIANDLKMILKMFGEWQG